MYTDAQILENRKKVVEYLQQPNLRKATTQLRNSDGGRCCLGHMCDVLGVVHLRVNSGGLVEHFYGDERSGELAPDELVEMVGLNSSEGLFTDGGPMMKPSGYGNCVEQSVSSLTSLNDDYRVSPQRIGKILSGMLMGGKGTPWKAINP